MSYPDPGARIIRTHVNWDGAGQTLAGYLAARFTYRSKLEWEKVIAQGEITLNGKTAAPETPLALHDCIEYHPRELPEPPAILDYQLVYSDPEVLVIDKPGNLCVHPAGPFFRHTLWFLLQADFGKEIYFVNRLDRETSGLLLVARTSDIAAKLAKSPIDKQYFAAVYGQFPAQLFAEGYLYQDSASLIRKKRFFSLTAPAGIKSETASTSFTGLECEADFSLLSATLHTGRMHQIRATLASLGYPVVGDKLYGPDESCYIRQKSDELTAADRQKLRLERQALHSARLRFAHPRSGENLEFSSPCPAEFHPEALRRI